LPVQFKIRAEWRLMGNCLSQALSDSSALCITYHHPIWWGEEPSSVLKWKRATLFHNCEFWVKLLNDFMVKHNALINSQLFHSDATYTHLSWETVLMNLKSEQQFF
jgi:hypothetical protein